MLEDLTHSDFIPHVGTPFSLDLGEVGQVELELIEVRPLEGAAGPPETKREPFSLLFRGPADAALHQQVYGLQHQALEPLELFLVPLQPDTEGTLFEAIFT